ncbi:hypothetical protein [Paraburkholderia sp. J67]|uniref:hypothetical protein n=1 Tax=Paraburkholderia sp. J67 TaxID=2805435 RepID=UPI002ABE8A4A|nr:hypothetical protein [Paraburkholderia sp. J67]
MLDRLREDVALVGITEQEIRRTLGYDRAVPAREILRSRDREKVVGQRATSEVVGEQTIRGLRDRCAAAATLAAKRRR